MQQLELGGTNKVLFYNNSSLIRSISLLFAFAITPAVEAGPVEDLVFCIQNTSNSECSVPSGTHLVNSEIEVTRAVTVRGQGYDSTILKRNSTSVRIMFRVRAANVTFRDLQLNGNKLLFGGTDSYGGLQYCNGYWYEADGPAQCMELRTYANYTTITSVKFKDSTLFALGLTGTGAQIASSHFLDGMNCGIFGDPASFQISSSTFRNYVGSAICLSHAQNGTIANNSLNYNHMADPTATCVGGSGEGGGQIWLGNSTNITVSSNWVDGENWNGPGVCPNGMRMPSLVNYGIEIDEGSGHTLENNTTTNHGRRGYYINSSTSIRLRHEKADFNASDGIEIAQNAGIGSVSIKSNAGGSPSEFTYNSGYGLTINSGVANNTVCIANDTQLSNNTLGTIFPAASAAYYYSSSCW